MLLIYMEKMNVFSAFDKIVDITLELNYSMYGHEVMESNH
jgi:hypothetical protein